NGEGAHRQGDPVLVEDLVVLVGNGDAHHVGELKGDLGGFPGGGGALVEQRQPRLLGDEFGEVAGLLDDLGLDRAVVDEGDRHRGGDRQNGDTDDQDDDQLLPEFELARYPVEFQTAP